MINESRMRQLAGINEDKLLVRDAVKEILTPVRNWHKKRGGDGLDYEQDNKNAWIDLFEDTYLVGQITLAYKGSDQDGTPLFDVEYEMIEHTEKGVDSTSWHKKGVRFNELFDIFKKGPDVKKMQNGRLK